MRDVHITISARALRWIATTGIFVAILLPVSAIASHTFGDVANSNTFHDDIAWLAEAGVTKGCNPPANTSFCPKDVVTREQMAAFMRRLANAGVVDAASVGGVDAASFYTKAEVDALVATASKPAIRGVNQGTPTTSEAGECIVFPIVTSTGSPGEVTGYTVTESNGDGDANGDGDGDAFLDPWVMMVAPLRYKWTDTNSACSGMLRAGFTSQDMPAGWDVTLVGFPTS